MRSRHREVTCFAARPSTITRDARGLVRRCDTQDCALDGDWIVTCTAPECQGISTHCHQWDDAVTLAGLHAAVHRSGAIA